MLIRNTLGLVLLVAGLARGAEPLVWFDFENGLTNRGTLGGAGQFVTYAPGEEPSLDAGPLGRCLDLTAASRHGGTLSDEDKAGGGVRFQHADLDALQTFTLTIWHRQNPLAQGPNPRLLTKDNAWDVLPQAGGVSLGLGPASQKISYALTGKHREGPADGWQFTAVVAEGGKLRAYIGGLGLPLLPCGEQSRQASAAAGAGDLVLGTLGGIRPFNGWLDQVRIFAEPLDEPALRAVYEADLATANTTPPTPFYARARPPAETHRFQLKRSDTPFSVRWQKRTEAPAVMQSFHATQCLWVYGADPAVIQRIRDLGMGYQGTLNGLQGTEQSTPGPAAQGDPTGRHENLDGQKNMPSWMVTFKPPHYTGCCNHPAFRELFFQAAKQLVDSGVDLLHVDDWAMNASWVMHGGVCFCEPCRAGFRAWLQQRLTPAELAELGISDISSFDYREHLRRNGVPDAATYRAKFRELPLTPQFIDFQVASMREFFREFRRRLDAWSPDRYIPVSANTLLTRLDPHQNLCGVDVLDFFVGESSQDAARQTAAEYVFAAKAAEACGLSQVVSPIPRSTARTRAALATTYALGQTHLVPWDLYMGSDATGIQPRYFGTREQYGDLYDFIHDHAGLLDGYESAAEIGVLANADEPGSPSLAQFCQQLAAQQLPFHLVLGASRGGRVPVRAADLEAVRLVVEFSPLASFCDEDQHVIQQVRESGATRFVRADADLAAMCRVRGLARLRVEGPEGIYAFPRVHGERRSAAIHLVNWNFGRDGERGELYRNVTLSLLAPPHWGPLAAAVFHQPGQPAAPLEPEVHDDCIRLTLPPFDTWGIVEIQAASP